jgi:hypothetical protein
MLSQVMIWSEAAMASGERVSAGPDMQNSLIGRYLPGVNWVFNETLPVGIDADAGGFPAVQRQLLRSVSPARMSTRLWRIWLFHLLISRSPSNSFQPTQLSDQ